MTNQSPFNYQYTANPNNGNAPTSLSALVFNFKKNFLEKSVEIVPGLTHNQYEVVKRTYFYIHNQFVSGPTDDNGDPKYFYDLVTDRNDQATKNIDLDTKDVYIKAESEGAYLKSWLLRREFMAFAKNTSFGLKLNQLAEDLPDFGTVVWKKCKDENGRTTVAFVELINLMNDPGVQELKKGIVIERHLLTQSDLYSHQSWDSDAIKALVNGGRTVSRVGFLDANAITAANTFNRTDETTPFYEVYEMWGEIPRSLYNKHKIGGIKRPASRSGLPDRSDFNTPGVSKQGIHTSLRDADLRAEVEAAPADGQATDYSDNESVYVMAIVAGIDTNQTEAVLFCKEVDRDLFPYKETHFRRRKGRWLGVGNYELLFPLTEKANELTNRFFSSMRITLLHLYQTRDNLHVKNVLTDLLDGDVVVSKSELTAIPTELRGAAQYRDEMNAIEAKADRMCSSLEVVTGANLPSNTPFKLGAQQLQSATKFFVFVQQNMGLFVENIFNEWLLPDFSAQLTDEHILDILDDAEDMQVYFDARRKLYQYDMLKRYILAHNQTPSPEQLQIAGQLVQDQIAKGPKQVKVEKNYYADYDYSIKMVITGENDTKKEDLETLSGIYQTTAANPAALQDPRLMKILNLILEETGFSPLQINSINQTGTNPSLNPANQGGGGADIAAAGGQPGQPVPSTVGAGSRVAVGGK